MDCPSTLPNKLKHCIFIIMAMSVYRCQNFLFYFMSKSPSYILLHSKMNNGTEKSELSLHIIPTPFSDSGFSFLSRKNKQLQTGSSCLNNTGGWKDTRLCLDNKNERILKNLSCNGREPTSCLSEVYLYKISWRWAQGHEVITWWEIQIVYKISYLNISIKKF